MFGDELRPAKRWPRHTHHQQHHPHTYIQPTPKTRTCKIGSINASNVCCVSSTTERIKRARVAWKAVRWRALAGTARKGKCSGVWCCVVFLVGDVWCDGFVKGGGGVDGGLVSCIVRSIRAHQHNIRTCSRYCTVSKVSNTLAAPQPMVISRNSWSVWRTTSSCLPQYLRLFPICGLGVEMGK